MDNETIEINPVVYGKGEPVHTFLSNLIVLCAFADYQHCDGTTKGGTLQLHCFQKVNIGPITF